MGTEEFENEKCMPKEKKIENYCVYDLHIDENLLHFRKEQKEVNR